MRGLLRAWPAGRPAAALLAAAALALPGRGGGGGALIAPLLPTHPLPCSLWCARLGALPCALSRSAAALMRQGAPIFDLTAAFTFAALSPTHLCCHTQQSPFLLAIPFACFLRRFECSFPLHSHSSPPRPPPPALRAQPCTFRLARHSPPCTHSAHTPNLFLCLCRVYMEARFPCFCHFFSSSDPLPPFLLTGPTKAPPPAPRSPPYLSLLRQRAVRRSLWET